MSWLWRGFQSAVFYYVSCAPCFKLRSRRRRRLENKRVNRSQTTSEAEEGLYRHTSPFSTNQYWREDMLLGPGPPQKRKDRDKNAGKEREKERTLGVGEGSLATGGSSADTTPCGVGEGGRNVGEGLAQARESEEGWNRKRYQREDEILWGHEPLEEEEEPDNSTIRLRSTTTGSSGNYYYARNPAVNDLHPPTVSTQPASKSQMKWMLQPPPSAKVMAGKEPASRSRSDSGGSKGSSLKKGNINLGRLVGEKLMEEKMRRGGEDGMMMSRMSSQDSKASRASSSTASNKETTITGQRHDRDRPSDTKQDADIQKPPLVGVADGIAHEQRPPLSTIPSTSLVDTAKDSNNPTSLEDRRITSSPLADISNRQTVMMTNTSDLHNSSFPPPAPEELQKNWKFPFPTMTDDLQRQHSSIMDENDPRGPSKRWSTEL